MQNLGFFPSVRPSQKYCKMFSHAPSRRNFLFLVWILNNHGMCVTSMHQHFVPLICLSGKNAVTDIHFLCTSVTYVRHSKTHAKLCLQKAL